MGRPRKLVAVSTADRSKKFLANAARTEEIAKTADERLKSPPSFLTQEAVELWRDIVADLSHLGALTDLDYDALARYCTMAITARHLEKLLMENVGDLDAMAEYMPELRRLSAEMTKLENRLHMSVSERLKLASDKVAQEDHAIDLKFGAI